MSMLTGRSPKTMCGIGKRLVEHGSYDSQRFQFNVKRAKVDGPNFKCNGIPKGRKVYHNVAVPAKSLRILPPNYIRTKDTKPLVSCAKVDSLKQNMIEKNVKGVAEEDKSKTLAASAIQACDKGKTSSRHILLDNGHPHSKLRKRVSVSKGFRRGVGMNHSNSGEFTDGRSQVEPKSWIGIVKVHDKLIADDIWGCSMTGKRTERNTSTENMVKDQHKLTQFIGDETCTVAQEKFALMDLSNAKPAPKTQVSGSRVSKLNSRADVSPPPGSNNPLIVACDESTEVVTRTKVLKSVELFEEQYTKLFKDQKRERRERGKATQRIDIRAAMILKEEGKWVNSDQEVGKVPGVEIGDQFQYRAELAIVGLNRQFNNGIDYIQVGGKLYATCVVDSGRYKNEMRSPDEFFYTGEGGNPKITRKKPVDQKLERGNLALKTSMDVKLPVRVIHCYQSLKAPKTLGVNNGSGLRYVYDGLYIVSSYRKERDDETGKLVFRFKMMRMPDEPILAVPRLPSEARKSTVEGKHGMLAGIYPPKEKKLALSVNATTDNEAPHFTYNSVLGGCCSRTEYSDPKKSYGPFRSESEAGTVMKAKAIKKLAYMVCVT